MENTQVDPMFLEALEEIELDDTNKQEIEEPVDSPKTKEEYEQEQEEEDVDFISATDMKIALCNFLKPAKSYKDKLSNLEEFLSEVLLQVSTRNKELQDERKAIEYDNKEDADFFEMFYDILFDGLAEDKRAFLNAYLESKSLFESFAIVEDTPDAVKQLFGADFKEDDIKNITPEQKKELLKKSKELSNEERSSLFKWLGKAWKKAPDGGATRAAAVLGAEAISPALGFIAQVLTGGLQRASK